MILDDLTQLEDSTAFTAGTTYTTYCYDCGNVTPKREIGTGEPMCLVFSVGVAAAGSTDTTSIAATSGTSATNGATGAKELASRVIANASLTAGSRHVLPIPPGSVDQRYIYGRIVLGSGDTITVDVNMIPVSFVGIFTNYADNVTWS